MVQLGFKPSQTPRFIFSATRTILEKAMAAHSSTLAWKVPWTEEPGRLQSMALQRVGPDWATSLLLFTFMIGEGNGNPLQCSCLENPRDGGAWWAAIYGIALSRTRLKRLSRSSSSSSVYMSVPSSQSIPSPHFLPWYPDILLLNFHLYLSLFLDILFSITGTSV